LDWLLLDAPLQHLRDNDGSWRLRVSINGDSFISDQNAPIWLKGWTSGSNSLQLELLDGRGKPLNPPFNSLVSELVLKPSAPKPRWQLGRLSAEELASLVGQTPTPAPEPPPQPTTKPEPEPEPKTQPKVQPQAVVEEPEPQASESQAAELQTVETQLAQPEPAQSETEISAPNRAESPGENDVQTLLEDNPALVFQPSDTKTGPNSEGIDDGAADQPTVLAEGSEEPEGEPPSANPNADAKPEAPPNPENLSKPDDLPKPDDLANLGELANRDDPAEPSDSGERDAVIPPPITKPDRLSPTTSVVGSARDQVHEDGSLIKPKRKGPLAGLRERLAS
jgi:hypothetical protein